MHSDSNTQQMLAAGDEETLVAVLDSHVHAHPDRIHIILEHSDKEADRLSHADLKKGAVKLAAGLQHHGLEPGDTVAIMLPTGADYFFIFFAILLCGGVPVSLYPPARPTQIEEHLRRHRSILRNAGTKIIITMPEVKTVARLLKAQVKTLEKVDTVAAFSGRPERFIPIAVIRWRLSTATYISVGDSRKSLSPQPGKRCPRRTRK